MTNQAALPVTLLTLTPLLLNRLAGIDAGIQWDGATVLTGDRKLACICAPVRYITIQGGAGKGDAQVVYDRAGDGVIAIHGLCN